MTDDQEKRCEEAAQEMRNVLDKYGVTFVVDIVSFNKPTFFLECNELLDDPPARLH